MRARDRRVSGPNLRGSKSRTVPDFGDEYRNFRYNPSRPAEAQLSHYEPVGEYDTEHLGESHFISILTRRL